MGFYIETDRPIDKARTILSNPEAKALQLGSLPTYVTDCLPGKVLVCVVENGPFDAAGIIFSQRELDHFWNDESGRPRTWLYVDREWAIKQCPHVKEVMEY